MEFRRPLFVAGTGLYLLVAAHKYGGPLTHQVHLPALLTSYAADVLALPLELTLVLYALRHWYFRQPSFVLPASWIFSTWLVFSIWFEGILPHFDHRATADLLDVVAYGVGGYLFWRWLNHPA